MGTRNSFDASEMKKQLLSMLECPICVETMRKPIFVCVNGHNICESCKKKVEKCPTCRDTFSNTRNFFAEETAEKFCTSCKYSSNGCTAKLMPEELKKHESKCFYGPVECLLGEGVDSIQRCGWRGKKEDLLAHVEETFEHTLYVWKRYPIKSPAYSITPESNYVEVDLIPRKGKLFWLFIKYDAIERKLYEAVQLIGSAEEASKYKYDHQLKSTDGEQTITFSNTVRSTCEDIETTLQSGKCFVLDYSILKNHCTTLQNHLGGFDIQNPNYSLTINKT